jgi:hypothetical protein
MSQPSYIFSNSIGYSGVLFNYAVIESFHSVETYRSIFGLFSVPVRAYPFALLIVLQVYKHLSTYWLYTNITHLIYFPSIFRLSFVVNRLFYQIFHYLVI